VNEIARLAEHLADAVLELGLAAEDMKPGALPAECCYHLREATRNVVEARRSLQRHLQEPQLN